MTTELQPRDWETLVLSIAQGDCVLMLGPDAVTEERDGVRQPVLQLFAQHLKSKLPPASSEVLPDDYTLAQAAQAYKNRTSRNDLISEAEQFFAQRKGDRDQVLVNLAFLPFKVIIDTAPGSHMEEALLAAEKEFVRAHYRAKGRRVEMAPEGTTERPLVYHLYGAATELKSLVLTENDLLDFLVAVVSEDPPLPNNISSTFAERGNCFLFLGFGFRHWYLRILLHVLYRGGIENRSFALERFDESLGRTTIQTTKLFFQEGHKIDFFDMELLPFSAELRRRVEARLRQKGPQDLSNPEPEGPIVFLCHASEDKAYALQLFEALKGRALRPWLDEKNIRGGATWDKEIRRVIREEVHYVLVLQSKALSRKTEGYVNREIKAALDRQEEFRQPLSFLIPVQVEPCERPEEARLDEVAHLQTIDLTQNGGLDALVSTIKRDYQLRRKGAK